MNLDGHAASGSSSGAATVITDCKICKPHLSRPLPRRTPSRRCPSSGPTSADDYHNEGYLPKSAHGIFSFHIVQKRRARQASPNSRTCWRDLEIATGRSTFLLIQCARIIPIEQRLPPVTDKTIRFPYQSRHELDRFGLDSFLFSLTSESEMPSRAVALLNSINSPKHSVIFYYATDKVCRFSL